MKTAMIVALTLAMCIAGLMAPGSNVSAERIIQPSFSGQN
jgi:hypothetical protein